MAKLAFVVLAHENAEQVGDLAALLVSWKNDCHVVIHYDRNSSKTEFAKLLSRFADNDQVHVLKNRVKCGWGDFSLVEAPMRALRYIRSAKIDCDRIMLISGACMPIRPLAELSNFLDRHPNMEFIESRDESWIKGGLRHERYQYRHIFNFQRNYKLFHWSYLIQRAIMPKRRFPRGLEPRWGSQWWCLSWKLCEKILDFVDKRKSVYRFFKDTWIPDESFFQTMAYRFTPNDKISDRTLTFFEFNDWGKPFVFLNDHQGILEDLPFFFARKIGGRALALREHFRDVALQPAAEPTPHIPARGGFPLRTDRLLAELPKSEANGPSLFHQLGRKGLAATLAYCQQPYAVLYGPPVFTAQISALLRANTDLTVLGRIMHPEKVDFGPGVNDFQGLTPDDVEIRNFDGGNYFSRILSRCASPLVFELCPGEHPIAERALLQSGAGMLLPIAPSSASDEAWLLFWLLCANSTQGAAALGAEETGSGLRGLWRTIDTHSRPEARTEIAKQLLRAREKQIASDEQFRQISAGVYGRVGDVIGANISKIDAALQAVSKEDILSSLAPPQRHMTSAFLGSEGKWEILRRAFPM
ncbi:beta-1,6-N-acetylglucosaminyltransferase [Rhizobium sp. TRM95796]|uniref:beta-1,6-N-acetylglucosaminyltransferase n=1 Tax=Rhizobium sp. TRM95796 TaxID=2979862 RepID=UPI0021E70830|nr:beta-1,6-N-acetylglucosaminyltransferase [Rhizobium sp. TRM95796]MCV3764387.1 beta-1,6-N-acetylglucosaminyltransferase [Rhizobium sp. TRM95796]